MINEIAEMELKTPLDLNSCNNTIQQEKKKKHRLAARRRRREKKLKRGKKSMLVKFGLPKKLCQIPEQQQPEYDNLTQFSTFNNNNTTKSVQCKICKLLQSSYANQNVCTFPGYQSDNDTHEKCEFFQHGELVLGGDWEFLARILGYTGANGVWFCPYCHCQLSDLQKGIPHAPLIFHRYRRNGAEYEFPQRSFSGMLNDHQEFASSGKQRSKVSQYNNCEYPPMMNASGPVINTLSVMPLHLALGLGLQIVNLCHEAAIALDVSICESKGLTSDIVANAYIKVHDLTCDKIDVESQHTQVSLELQAMQQNIREKQEENPEYHKKENGHVTVHTVEAVKARREMRELTKAKQEVEKQKKALGKELEELEISIKSEEEVIEKEQGPFLKRYNSVMEGLSLKRRVYHSGALVGNDIDKLFGAKSKNNIIKLSKVYQETNIKLHNGEEKSFGSAKLVQIMRTLMEKFSSIYQLMSPSRPLCKHEVNILKVRCYSFGNWFPANFPNTNLKRKFHILTYHVPEKAELRATVGMEAEHISESIHPIVNALKRRYATVQSLKDQLPLICKDQWLMTNPKVPDFREANHRKICQKCLKFHYKDCS